MSIIHTEELVAKQLLTCMSMNSAESISEGTLKTWLKKPGDWVKADEEIASIETDKVG